MRSGSLARHAPRAQDVLTGLDQHPSIEGDIDRGLRFALIDPDPRHERRDATQTMRYQSK
jgi:hypothetical protein